MHCAPCHDVFIIASLLLVWVHPCGSQDGHLHAQRPPSAYTPSWNGVRFSLRCNPFIQKFREVQGYGNPPLVWSVHRHGLGDRLRGFVNAVVTAMMLNRTFLADLSAPEFDSRFLVNAMPNVRWTISVEELTEMQKKANHTTAIFDHLRELEAVRVDAGMALLTHDDQFMTNSTVQWLHDHVFHEKLSQDRPIRGGKHYGKHYVRINYAFCPFHMLLRPTDDMTLLVQRYLSRAHPIDATAPIPHSKVARPSDERGHRSFDTLIVGLHVRFGGQWGDDLRTTDEDALFVIK